MLRLLLHHLMAIAGGFFWASGVSCAADDRSSVPESADSIDEAGYVRIGGIEQWITIKGGNRENPVILFLHGGPGNPMSAWSESVYGSWESEFTIVQWDQRAAGRTYARNEPVEELTMERFHATVLTIDLMVQDGIEVAEYLVRHLGQEKIILTGTSWGSVLGVHIARKRPELFHAYVGVSQIVDYGKMLSASYAKTLDRAISRNDTPAIELLESLGPPPWENPRNFGKLRRVLRAYETEVTSAAPSFRWAPEYETEADRAAFVAGEDLSFLKFVGLKGDGMGSRIALYELGPVFELPVFLVQGAEDLLTVPEITRDYYEWIEAPAKFLTLVPAAGHDPNAAMIAAQLELIRERVVPLID